MRGLALLTLILAIAATAGAAALLAFSIIEREPGLIWPAIALAIVPWVIWAVVNGAARNQGRKAFEAAVAGLPAADAQWFNGSGIALDRAGRQVLAGGRDGTVMLGLADISGLRYVPPEAGNVSAAGMSNMGVVGLLLAALSIGNATASYVGSGLHIIPRAPGRKPLHVFGIGKKDAEDWIARLVAAEPAISVLDA